MTDEEIANYIVREPHGRTTLKNLARELRVRGEDKESLESALERLVNKGLLIEMRSGQFMATQSTREFSVGKLSMHRDGFGFVKPIVPIPNMVGDIFIGSQSAAKAMHGDRVMVRVSRVDRDGKADGEIVRILERAYRTVVGEFRVRRQGNFVKPHDERIKQWVFIPDGYEIPPQSGEVDRIGKIAATPKSLEEMDGLIVNVELLEYPEQGEDAVGRVIEILGGEDDFGVDVEIMIRKHQLPHQFPEEVLAQARAMPTEVSATECEGRVDYRNLDIVTIDGETARDFDDAIYAELLPNGNFQLQVHIADVSHYVTPQTPLDIEAAMRGTSVYFPDRAVPMLPVELSTEICSLKPHVDRLVVSMIMEIDHQGDILGQQFHRGVIRSAERMTYTNVQKLYDGDAEQRERYSRLIGRFDLMKELAEVLLRHRQKRGSIDFDLPEPIIELDEAGQMVSVLRSPRLFSQRLIEEFMLAANQAVASELQSKLTFAMYRIHELPDSKRVAAFEEIAAHFGYSLTRGALPVTRHAMVEKKRDGRKVRKDIELVKADIGITSKDYQKLIRKLEGKPEERILNYLMLRSLRQARYSASNEGHFALAMDHYTHFTSPIRRYPDLIVHRLLLGAKYSDQELKEIADDTSFTERRSADAERELIEWKKLKFMIQYVGETFRALITNTTKYGFFVELEELFVEGLVAMDSLPGDKYFYQEAVRRIVGQRTRREFKIGDEVSVLLERVNSSERKLEFSLFEESAPKTKKKKKK